MRSVPPRPRARCSPAIAPPAATRARTSSSTSSPATGHSCGRRWRCPRGSVRRSVALHRRRPISCSTWPSGSRGARGGRASLSSPGSRQPARPYSPRCSPPAPASPPQLRRRFASSSSASRRRSAPAAAAYGASVNRRTYAELGRLARRELECAAGVIVDATLRRADDRSAFLDRPRRPAGRLRGRVPRSRLGPAGARSSPCR